MLLMVERSFRNGICHAIHQEGKTNKYMKDCDQNKESAYLSIGMPVICMDVVHP